MKERFDIMDNVYITKLLLKDDIENVEGHPNSIPSKIKGAIGIDIKEKQLLKFKL